MPLFFSYSLCSRHIGLFAVAKTDWVVFCFGSFAHPGPLFGMLLPDFPFLSLKSSRRSFLAILICHLLVLYLAPFSFLFSMLLFVIFVYLFIISLLTKLWGPMSQRLLMFPSTLNLECLLVMPSHNAWYIGYSLNIYWINKTVAHFYPFFEILPGSQLSLWMNLSWLPLHRLTSQVWVGYLPWVFPGTLGPFP